MRSASNTGLGSWSGSGSTPWRWVMKTSTMLGLRGIVWARARSETIRRGLLKIGAQVRVTARKVWVSLGSGYPYAGLFAAVYRALRPPGPATV